MKVIKRDSQCLSLKGVPYLFKGVGAIFFLTGLGMLAVLCMTHTLVCRDKAPGIAKQCELKHSILGLYQYEEHIQDLKHAVLYRYRNNKGNVQYHIRLKGQDHNVFVNFFPTFFRSSSDKVVVAINHYIEQSNQTRFRLPFYMNYILGFIGSVFTVIGFIFLTSINTVCVHLDRGTNLLTVTRRNVWGRTKETYPLDKITQIEIETSRGNKGTMYRVIVVLDDNTVIPLTKQADNILGPKLSLADKLNDFLDLTPHDTLLEARGSHEKLSRYAKILFCCALAIIAVSMSFIVLKH